MTSPSDPRFHQTTGLTLFEALIALSILALVLGVTLGARPGPSPGLLLKRDASDLIQTATRLRMEAITTGQPTTLTASTAPCSGTQIDLVFFPDGTAWGGDLCLTRADKTLRLRLDPLTGTLAHEAAP